jgi:hypothetical protein
MKYGEEKVSQNKAGNRKPCSWADDLPAYKVSLSNKT